MQHTVDRSEVKREEDNKSGRRPKKEKIPKWIRPSHLANDDDSHKFLKWR